MKAAASQNSVARTSDQLVDQMGGGGEAYAEALLAGGEAEGESDLRLPTPLDTSMDYVLA